jgi:hypothetical protein
LLIMMAIMPDSDHSGSEDELLPGWGRGRQ